MENSKENILGILPSLGGSIESQRRDRREGLFVGTYIPKYESQFTEVRYFSYANENDRLGTKTIIFPNRWRIHRYLYCWLLPFLYAYEIRKCRLIRVMHLNGALPAAIAKLFYGVPFVSTYGYDYVQFAKLEGHPIKAFLIRLLIPFLLRLAAGVIVTTEELRSEVARYIGRSEKVQLVPNGVNSTVFKPASKSTGSGIAFRLLFVGRLERQKNLFFMLDILAILKDKLPVCLTIVGSGSFEQELREVAGQKNLPVQLTDKIPYSEMAKCYQNADCFISTSLAEGHPKALIEAMSCALPCVVSECAGNSTLIRNNENGFLLQLGNPQMWADQIIKLALSKPLQEKFSRAARALVVERFDHAITLNLEIQFLQSLIA